MHGSLPREWLQVQVVAERSVLDLAEVQAFLWAQLEQLIVHGDDHHHGQRPRPLASKRRAKLRRLVAPLGVRDVEDHRTVLGQRLQVARNCQLLVVVAHRDGVGLRHGARGCEHRAPK